MITLGQILAERKEGISFYLFLFINSVNYFYCLIIISNAPRIQVKIENVFWTMLGATAGDEVEVGFCAGCNCLWTTATRRHVAACAESRVRPTPSSTAGRRCLSVAREERGES